MSGIKGDPGPSGGSTEPLETWPNQTMFPEDYWEVRWADLCVEPRGSTMVGLMQRHALKSVGKSEMVEVAEKEADASKRVQTPKMS